MYISHMHPIVSPWALSLYKSRTASCIWFTNFIMYISHTHPIVSQWALSLYKSRTASYIWFTNFIMYISHTHPTVSHELYHCINHEFHHIYESLSRTSTIHCPSINHRIHHVHESRALSLYKSRTPSDIWATVPLCTTECIMYMCHERYHSINHELYHSTEEPAVKQERGKRTQ